MQALSGDPPARAPRSDAAPDLADPADRGRRDGRLGARRRWPCPTDGRRSPRSRRSSASARHTASAARSALQLVAGVVLGICVASAIVALIGTGLLQMGLLVVLAMSAAVLLGGGELLTGRGGRLGDPARVAGPGHQRPLFTVNRILEGPDRRRRRARRHLAVLPARPGAARRPRRAGGVLRARRRTGAAGGGAGRRATRRRGRGAGRGAGARRAGREFDETLRIGRETARLAPRRRGDAGRARPLRRELRPGRLRGARHPRARPPRPAALRSAEPLPPALPAAVRELAPRRGSWPAPTSARSAPTRWAATPCAPGLGARSRRSRPGEDARQVDRPGPLDRRRPAARRRPGGRHGGPRAKPRPRICWRRPSDPPSGPRGRRV